MDGLKPRIAPGSKTPGNWKLKVPAGATTLFTRKPSVRALAVAVAVTVAAVGGGVIGFLAQPAVATTSEYKAMKADLTDQLDQRSGELATAESQVQALEDRESGIAVREAAVAQSEEQLTAGQAKLQQDQDAFKAEQQQVIDSKFSDGLHMVGTTVVPGVYAITTSDRCYYVWKSGTGSDANIIDNNIVNGPATVTLKVGDVFETTRCGSWTKVG